MRNRLFSALVLSLGAVAAVAPAASAHTPDGGYQSYYYGNGPHDLRPHWHQYVTPYGTYSYYGNGPHDLVPHGHYRYYGPYSRYYGGYRRPYDYGRPYYYGQPYYYRYGRPYYYGW